MAKTPVIRAQQKWDYCYETRRTENSIIAAVCDLGQRGWELANVVYHKDPKGETAWTAFLKRPSAGPAPGPPPPVANSVSTTQKKEGEAVLQGFDLTGDSFQLKTE